MKVSLKGPLVFVVLSLGGCTSISVEPMNSTAKIEHACIQENSKVIRGDMLPTIQKGFKNHGISTKVYRDNVPESCEYVVTYTATQTWDMAMVLKDAEIWIHKSGVQVAYGNYHLKGGGGFSLMKWQGAEKKILPMIDELLAGYNE